MGIEPGCEGGGSGVTLTSASVRLGLRPFTLAISCIAFACFGCGETSFSSQITGYNHTDKTIGSFDVNGVWGGNAVPHSGGGSSTCCLQLPLPWRPGLTVQIDWEDEKGQQHVRVVPVPRFDAKSLGIFNVHFLRSGEIAVFEINAGLGHPDYPLKGEEANLKPGVPNFQWPREVPVSK